MIHHSSSMLLFLVLMATQALDARGEKKVDAAVDSQVVHPQQFVAGVVDDAARIGYLENDGDTIAAVDLATGKELWKSEGTIRPLIGFEGRMYVMVRQGNSLLIHWLEPATGKKIGSSEAIALPDWRNRPIRWGGSAVIRAGQLLLHCFIVEDSNGGVPPLTAMFRAKVDLKSGKVDVLAANQAHSDFYIPHPKELKKFGDLEFKLITTVEIPHPHFKNWKRTVRATNAEGKVV